MSLSSVSLSDIVDMNRWRVIFTRPTPGEIRRVDPHVLPLGLNQTPGVWRYDWIPKTYHPNTKPQEVFGRLGFTIFVHLKIFEGVFFFESLLTSLCFFSFWYKNSPWNCP